MKQLYQKVGITVFILTALAWTACKKTPDLPDESPKLIFRFVFDSTQVRLNNLGLAASLPAGHAAQSPQFNAISAHYVELAPLPLTLLGQGAVVYKNAETTSGGETAIDFAEAKVVSEGETFLSIPLSTIPAGTYTYLRTSLSYQNYDIKLRAMGLNIVGTLASFIGYNTFINNFLVKSQTVAVHGNRKQGYWAFETPYTLNQGQAPEGATTVPNPLFATSPVPQGSCIVTGAFDTPLQITGNETTDIIVDISLSTNKSFEWIETANNTTFDPMDGDMPVDMGIRGLIAKVK